MIYCSTTIPVYCCPLNPLIMFYQRFYYPSSYRKQQKPYFPQSPFPPVNIEKFDISAHQFQKLMEQAKLFVNKIATSAPFAYELMDAAQRSDKKRVEEMIRSTGITIAFRVQFTPTAIQIILNNSTEKLNCCELLVSLKW